MYVCGPTVYAAPHIGNARSVVIYDLLYRVLKQQYSQVTYVRNITDVDDKINKAAVENGEPIQALTDRITKLFDNNMQALGCLQPTHTPKATQSIAEIIQIIEQLIANGNAYVAEGHVLFDVTSYKDYGQLSRRSLEQMQAGARIDVASYKRNPHDFVLWKPPLDIDDESSIFDSPWGKGRPGWHIECSAMSHKFLGQNFDIHGGGADLKFPHHENEIAQSRCAHKDSTYANYWVHNGFLTVEGEKMSKSLGNFLTVEDILANGTKGEVIRWVLLSSHYRKPLDWSAKLLADAKKTLDGFYRATQNITQEAEVDSDLIDALQDDLNTPKAFAILQNLATKANKGDVQAAAQLSASLKFLGFLNNSADEWFGKTEIDDEIEQLIAQRSQARKNKDWALADKIRDELNAKNIILDDKPDGTVEWRRG